MTRESDVRNYLRDECKKLGWECLPLVLPTRRGWPDRTILGPGGRAAFVEVKAPGARHDPAHLEQQRKFIRGLEALGFPAFIARGKKEIDFVLEELQILWR